MTPGVAERLREALAVSDGEMYGRDVETLIRELAARGLVVVPVEPTEEMWTAGRDPVMFRDVKLYPGYLDGTEKWNVGPDGKKETDTSKGTTAVHVWRAMIGAVGHE